MKVHMLATSYPRFHGDIAGTFVKSLAVHLVELGHEVHVLAPDDGLSPSSPGCAVDGVIEHRFPYAPIERLRVLGYAKALEGDRHLKKLSYGMAVPFLIASFLALRSMVSRFGADVLHAHWVLPNGLPSALVSRGFRLPMILSLHGSDVFLAERGLLFQSTARRAFAASSCVASCSTDLRDRAIRIGASPSRSVVIPYGVSADEFRCAPSDAQELRSRLRIPETAPVVLGLGRLVYKKGFEYLIDSFQDVRRACPEAILIIGGDGYLAEALRERARKCGIAEDFCLPGNIPWTDVPRYLAAADVVVVPSVTDATGNVDGLPNVLLEAMAAEKGIVATRVGGIPEVLTHEQSGILVDQRDSTALANGIIRLLRDRALASDLGQTANQFVREQLGWDKVARQYESIYHAATTSQRRSPGT